MHEPLQGSLAGIEHRDVAVLRTKPQLCRGATALKPPAMRTGHDPVPTAVDEKNRHGDLRRVEPPRGHVCEVIIDGRSGPAATAGRTTARSQDHVPESAARSAGVNSGS